ncbi:plasmid mobilization protein [Pseudobutyrivibrio sp.]
MGKIYRRETLKTSTTPKKKDEKRRKRNVIMNFRVSPEEKERIEERIALSGLMKSEYFINSCLDNKVVAYGNVRTFEKIKQSLIDIEEHLSGIERTDELDPVVMEQLLMILELYQGLDKGKASPGERSSTMRTGMVSPGQSPKRLGKASP